MGHNIEKKRTWRVRRHAQGRRKQFLTAGAGSEKGTLKIESSQNTIVAVRRLFMLLMIAIHSTFLSNVS